MWLKALLVSVVGVLFLLYSPTLLDFQPTSYRTSFRPLTGPLEINNKLSEAEHLFAGSISGPESIVVHDGALYTGTENGMIVKIIGKKMIPLAQTGSSCNIPYEEKLCGRPLGLRMGKDGLLYIADAYYGIHRMNVTTGHLTRILSNTAVVEEKKLTFPDDLDIDNEGNVYFSDASTKWDVSNIYYLVMEHIGNGRILRFNIKSGKTEVVLKDLYFPNGVQISHDGNSLLVCEVSSRRILRHFIKGPKNGQTAVFIDNLPGEPDNIRPSLRGGYWVALAMARNDSNPLIFDMLAPYPTVRRLIGRALHGFGSLLMAVAELTSSHVFKSFAYTVKRGDIFISLIPQHGLIIELDKDGNVVRNFQAPDGSTSILSQVTEHDGYLYLGSFVNHYLGKLKLV